MSRPELTVDDEFFYWFGGLDHALKNAVVEPVVIDTLLGGMYWDCAVEDNKERVEAEMRERVKASGEALDMHLIYFKEFSKGLRNIAEQIGKSERTGIKKIASGLVAGVKAYCERVVSPERARSHNWFSWPHTLPSVGLDVFTTEGNGPDIITAPVFNASRYYGGCLDDLTLFESAAEKFAVAETEIEPIKVVRYSGQRAFPDNLDVKLEWTRQLIERAKEL